MQFVRNFNPQILLEHNSRRQTSKSARTTDQRTINRKIIPVHETCMQITEQLEKPKFTRTLRQESSNSTVMPR
jgi:hypothetical protein